MAVAPVAIRLSAGLINLLPPDSLSTCSSADADLDEFSSFFRARGIVDSFVSDWISPFRFGEAGSGKPPSFLWDRLGILPWEIFESIADY